MQHGVSRIAASAAIAAGAAAASYAFYKVRPTHICTHIHLCCLELSPAHPFKPICVQLCSSKWGFSWPWLRVCSTTSKLSPVVDGVLGAIGNTPLIRIASLSEQTGCEVRQHCGLVRLSVAKSPNHFVVMDPSSWLMSRTTARRL